MARKIKVIVEQGVKIDGKYPAIGSEIDIEGNEAKRLLGLGAVCLPRPKLEEAQQADKGGKGGKNKRNADIEALIEQIQAASSQDELEELVAGNEKLPAVVDAASARLEELIAAEQ